MSMDLRAEAEVHGGRDALQHATGAAVDDATVAKGLREIDGQGMQMSAGSRRATG
jgi:hypothetical protein